MLCFTIVAAVEVVVGVSTRSYATMLDTYLWRKCLCRYLCTTSNLDTILIISISYTYYTNTHTHTEGKILYYVKKYSMNKKNYTEKITSFHAVFLLYFFKLFPSSPELLYR